MKGKEKTELEVEKNNEKVQLKIASTFVNTPNELYFLFLSEIFNQDITLVLPLVLINKQFKEAIEGVFTFYLNHDFRRTHSGNKPISEVYYQKLSGQFKKHAKELAYMKYMLLKKK